MSDTDIEKLEKDKETVDKDVERLTKELDKIEHPDKGVIVDPDAIVTKQKELDQAKKRQEALERLLDPKANPDYTKLIKGGKNLDTTLGGLISTEDAALKKKEKERGDEARKGQFADQNKLKDLDRQIERESRILQGKRLIKDALAPPKAVKTMRAEFRIVDSDDQELLFVRFNLAADAPLVVESAAPDIEPSEETP